MDAVCDSRSPASARLRETLEQFANEQWLPAHATREEAAKIVLDQVERTIVQSIKKLAVATVADA